MKTRIKTRMDDFYPHSVLDQLMDPMKHALSLAMQARDHNEVPVGAVITNQNGTIIGQGRNQMRALKDPTAHAEIMAIRDAAQRIGNERLMDCDLYVTLEPCAMCTSAIAHARLRRLYFGAADAKTGAVESNLFLFDQASCHHRPEVYGGFHAQQCGDLLRDFFQMRRNDQSF